MSFGLTQYVKEYANSLKNDSTFDIPTKTAKLHEYAYSYIKDKIKELNSIVKIVIEEQKSEILDKINHEFDLLMNNLEDDYIIDKTLYIYDLSNQLEESMIKNVLISSLETFEIELEEVGSMKSNLCK